MTNALLIGWDPSTGKRAGNIDPRDPGLFCNAWQNMDVSPAIELRIIKDDRDIKPYVTMKNVTVLYGTTEINTAIDLHFPPKFSIDDETIYQAHINNIANEIDFEKLPDNHMARLEFLQKNHNIKGISKIKPEKV